MQKTQIVNTDNCFTAETSSYRIRISFLDYKLMITLQDLVKFIVYSKVYAEDDTSGQINKRVTLEDIFYSLTEYGHQKSEQSSMIYQFGNIVKKKNVPYFKIQENGKITVYVSIFDRRKEQQVNYESILKLDKIRDMTQLQIIRQQSIIQRRKLLAQIANMKKKNEQVQNILVIKNTEIDELNRRFQAKSKQSKLRNQQLKGITLLRQRISNSMKEFTFTKPSSVDGYSQSIYNRAIPFDGVHTFQVKIIRAPNRYVGIGIVDYEKHRTVSCYYNSGYVVAYYWWYLNQGQKYPGETIESVGFNQGQTVEVRVDLPHRLISWSVNGAIRATHTNELLGDQSRIFMPYVEVYYNKTSVQWL